MKFLEGLFGESKKEEGNKKGRGNDGGNFMAVPRQDYDLSDEEVAKVLKQREARETGEDIRNLGSKSN